MKELDPFSAYIEVQEAKPMIQKSSYYSIKIQKIKDWANPIKRAQMKAEQKNLEDFSKKEIFNLDDQPWVRDSKPPFHINEGVWFKDEE